MKYFTVIVFVLALLLSVAGCGTSGDTTTPESSAYWPTSGWQVSTPEEQGMDSGLLAEALDFLQEQDDYEVHSLLVIRNGYIVTDAYFYPFAEGIMHNIFSVTKSVTATLIGIALDQGYIESVEQPVLGFFPESKVANMDAKKEAMTLEDLLTMQTGFDFISMPEITVREMTFSPDWVQFTLDLPVTEEPSTRWAYCSSGSHLLSAIIQQTTGMSTLEFAGKYLFVPLGISDVIWPSDPQGINHGWSDLHITPHDMAKIGYLYLNDGLWEGKQVVPAEWVAASTDSHVVLTDGDGYGYQWWTSPGYYSAIGMGGQYIIVSPDKDMVVVLTGGRSFPGVLQDLLSSYIFPAVKSVAPLPANPSGVALLESRIEQLSRPSQVQPEPVPPQPAIAGEISGKTYQLDDNPFGSLSITLTFSGQDEVLLRITTTGVMTLGDTDFEWLIGLDNVARISPGVLGLPAAAKGAWETDSFFSARIDEICSYHAWQVGLHFEEDSVICRIQDLEDTVTKISAITGYLQDGSGFIPAGSGDLPEEVPPVTVTNPSPPKTPDKPGWWVISVRSGPGSDFDLVRLLDPGDTATAVGRNGASDWLLLDGGGWVAAWVVTVEGDIYELPVVEAPASP
jgi:CubicO group peptidase (beta-lactamase class C family)